MPQHSKLHTCVYHVAVTNQRLICHVRTMLRPMVRCHSCDPPLHHVTNAGCLVAGLSTVAACAPSDKFLYMSGPLAIGLGVVLASSVGQLAVVVLCMAFLCMLDGNCSLTPGASALSMSTR